MQLLGFDVIHIGWSLSGPRGKLKGAVSYEESSLYDNGNHVV